MAYATVTLTGTYQTPDGTPHKGHVEIIPSERVIKDTTGDIILTGRVKVDLDAQGAFTVVLPATDDPTLNPTGFGYTIAAKLHSSHPPAVSFSLPASLGATTVEDVTPVDPSTFTPTTTYAEQGTVDALDTRVTTVETTKADSADLATVATSGNYTDLTGQPTIPTTAAEVGALPDTTVIPSTAADVGALPDTTTPADIGAETPTGAQTKVDTLANTLPTTYAAKATAVTTDTTQTITGQKTLTTPLLKGGPHYDVRAYNAKGDGVTNDTAAIQATINAAAAAGGGVVFFPTGTYMVGSYIAMKDKVSLRGAGAEASILRAKTGLTVAILVGTSGDTINDLTTSDLTLDGDYATTAASIHGIQMTGAARVTVERCWIKNVGVIGVLIQSNSADVTVQNNRISETGLGNAASGFGVRILQSQRCKVRGNRITGTRGMGVNAGDPGANASLDVEVTGNHIDMSASTTYEAIGITADCLRAVVANNHCVNNMDNGISLTASHGTVTGNIVDGAENAGIALGGSNCTVTGNWIRNAGREVSANTYGGINIAGGSYNVITGNRCFDDQPTKTQDYGVRESSPGNYNLITGNVLAGNLTSATSVSGANTLVANNIT